MTKKDLSIEDLERYIDFLNNGWYLVGRLGFSSEAVKAEIKETELLIQEKEQEAMFEMFYRELQEMKECRKRNEQK